MRGSRSSEAEVVGSEAARPLDATAIELATGLSIADVEALGSDPSPTIRAKIAVKFAREFDRLAKGPINKLTGDLLGVFSRDADRQVRMRFADGIRTSPHLPPSIATRLAKDEIDVAAPILRESPVLDETVLGDIIKTRPEIHALAIADRRPLSAALVDLLIEYKGTVRLVTRLLDNDEADISEKVLLDLRDWGRSNPDIASCLSKRPNLPFAFVDQSIVELADKVQWPSLGQRIMTRSEATQLQSRFQGKSGYQSSSKGARYHRLQAALKQDFERGALTPSTLLAFLRDRDIDRLECGFSTMSGLDLRRVRGLLHDSDRRGLIALCLKADFSTADYLAFRMALSLAELGTVREQPIQRYDEKAMRFARDQFEKMRAEPHRLGLWLPSDAA